MPKPCLKERHSTAYAINDSLSRLPIKLAPRNDSLENARRRRYATERSPSIGTELSAAAAAGVEGGFVTPTRHAQSPPTHSVHSAYCCNVGRVVRRQSAPVQHSAHSCRYSMIRSTGTVASNLSVQTVEIPAMTTTSILSNAAKQRTRFQKDGRSVKAKESMSALHYMAAKSDKELGQSIADIRRKSTFEDFPLMV